MHTGHYILWGAAGANIVTFALTVTMEIIRVHGSDPFHDTVLTWRAIALIAFATSWLVLLAAIIGMTIRGQSISLVVWFWMVAAGFLVTALLAGLLRFLFP
jgi:hypothetical protein